jgi:protein SCO1/2
MKRFVLLIPALVMAVNLRGAVVDVEPQFGRAVAQIDWTDETNDAHHLSQFAGYPLIVLPIFTRCRTACIQNVAQLKKALAASSADPRQFRVLLFSFDPTDTPAVLARYRERESIPLSWSIGVATQPNIDAFLDSLGFRVGKAGTQFSHPNMLLFLDPNLRIAHWTYGTDYSPGEIEKGLRIASGGSSWLARHSEWLYAILVFAGSILCVALCYHLIQLRARRPRIEQPVLAGQV